MLLHDAFYNGIATNNVAEYTALITALGEIEKKLGVGHDLSLFTDSQLMANQINGRFKVKDKGLKVLNSAAKELLSHFRSYTIASVPREEEHIAAVDRQLNLLLDERAKGI